MSQHSVSQRVVIVFAIIACATSVAVTVWLGPQLAAWINRGHWRPLAGKRREPYFAACLGRRWRPHTRASSEWRCPPG
jgi:hypothetical protein